MRWKRDKALVDNCTFYHLMTIIKQTNLLIVYAFVTVILDIIRAHDFDEFKNQHMAKTSVIF